MMKPLLIILSLVMYSAAAETDKTPESRSPAPEKFPSIVPKQTVVVPK